MSNNATDAAPGGSTARKPTDKEAVFFLTILNSMKNKPEGSFVTTVDWDLVAARAGYSNGTCAKVRFAQIKKAICYEGVASVPDATSSKPGGACGSGTNKSPSKVQKKTTTPRKPRLKKAEAQDKHVLSSSNQIKTEAAANDNWDGADTSSMQYDHHFDQLTNHGDYDE